MISCRKLFIICTGFCSVKSKDEPTLTIVDKSKSYWCTSDRLLPKYDEILLKIRADGDQMDAVNITWRCPSESKKRKPKQICQIEFISELCQADQLKMCYCSSMLDGLYLLHVYLPALTYFSEAEVKVQGMTDGHLNQLSSTVILPVIKDFMSVALSVNNQSMEIFPFPEITLKQNTTHVITVCPSSASKTALARWQRNNESVVIDQCKDARLNMVEDFESLCLTGLVTCGLNDSICVDFIARPEMYMEDKSMSSVCSSGLMATVDKIHVEIFYDTFQSTPADNIYIFFVNKHDMWLEGVLDEDGYEEVDNVTSMTEVCQINLKLCSSGQTICFCSIHMEEQYFISIIMTAKIELSEGYLLAMKSTATGGRGKLARLLEIPKIHGDMNESAALFYDGEDILTSKCSVNLSVYAGENLTFCTYNLHEPSIQLTVNSILVKSFSSSSSAEPCMTSEVVESYGTNLLVYSYQDKCMRSGTVECTIWGVSETVNTPSSEATRPYDEELDPSLSSGWSFIWYILMSFVFFICMHIIYCYRVNACCFGEYTGQDIPLVIFQDLLHDIAQPSIDIHIKSESSLNVKSVSDSVDPTPAPPKKSSSTTPSETRSK